MERREPRFSTYNVVASFADESIAANAARAVSSCGVPSSAVTLDRRTEQRAELRAEMQGEIEHMGGAGPAFAATSTQLRGALTGSIAGAFLGALVGLMAGLAWGYGVDSAVSPTIRLLLPILGAGVAGATAGLVAGGGLAPRMAAQHDESRDGLEDRAMVAEWTHQVGVHTDDPAVAQRAIDAFADLVPVQLDLFDADGTPLPRQHFHPRPADPVGRWWRRAEG